MPGHISVSTPILSCQESVDESCSKIACVIEDNLRTRAVWVRTMDSAISLAEVVRLVRETRRDGDPFESPTPGCIMSAMRKTFVAGCVLALVATAAVDAAFAARAVTSEPVITGSGDQVFPDATMDALVWTDHRRHRGNHVYFRQFGSSRIRVDEPGWQGIGGSFAKPGRLVYQQYKTTGRDSSNLYVFNTRTKTHHRLRQGVSTRDWRYWPTASSDVVLFNRCYIERASDKCERRSKRALLLYNPQDPNRVGAPANPRPRATHGHPRLCRRNVRRLDRMLGSSCRIRYYDFEQKEYGHRLPPKVRTSTHPVSMKPPT